MLPTVVGLAGFLMVQVALSECYGTLHVFDAATAGFRALTPAPRPGCPACAATGRTAGTVPVPSTTEVSTERSI